MLSYDPMTTNMFFRSNPSPKIYRKYSLNSTTMSGWNASSRNSFADDQPIRYEPTVQDQGHQKYQKLILVLEKKNHQNGGKLLKKWPVDVNQRLGWKTPSQIFYRIRGHDQKETHRLRIAFVHSNRLLKSHARSIWLQLSDESLSVNHDIQLDIA